MKTYLIYDGENTNLFADDLIIEAKTGKEAILKHLKNTGRNYKIKRSKGNDVIFKAQGIRIKGGLHYRDGNAIWYAIVF